MPTVLRTCKPGQWAVIKSIASGELSPRLLEMGLYEGKKLKVLFTAPLGCPMAIDAGGYTLSLRLDEAGMITVETEAA